MSSLQELSLDSNFQKEPKVFHFYWFVYVCVLILFCILGFLKRVSLSSLSWSELTSNPHCLDLVAIHVYQACWKVSENTKLDMAVEISTVTSHLIDKKTSLQMLSDLVLNT